MPQNFNLRSFQFPKSGSPSIKRCHTINIWCFTLGPVFFKALINDTVRLSPPSESLQMIYSWAAQLTQSKDRISPGGTWTGLRIGPMGTSTSARCFTWGRAVPGMIKGLEHVSYEQAERAGLVQHRGENASGRPQCTLSVLKGGL